MQLHEVEKVLKFSFKVMMAGTIVGGVQNKVRVPLMQRDIAQYEELVALSTWDYDAFCCVSSIRKFREDSCTCRKFLQYSRCHHARAIAIKKGKVPLTEVEEPDDAKKSAGRPAKPGTTRKSKKANFLMTHCYICNKACQHFYNLKEHPRSRKHIRRMQALSDFLRVSKKDALNKKGAICTANFQFKTQTKIYLQGDAY